MKKCVLKVALIAIFMILAFTINTQAASFSCKFENVNNVKIGDTVEIPLLLYNVDTNSAVKKLKAFSGKVEFDEDIFELVPYGEGDNQYYMEDESKITSEGFTNETKSFVIRIGDSYILDNIQDAKKLRMGYIKLKVKEGAPTGDYELTTYNMTAGTGEDLIEGSGASAIIHVEGINQENEEENNYGESTSGEGERTRIDSESKEAILNITVNAEKTKATIAPDEENGEEIASLFVDDVEIKKVNGKFEFSIKPNIRYKIVAYNSNGQMVYSDTFVVEVADEDKSDEKDSNQGNTTNETDDKDNENKDNTAKNETQEDVKKSAQTNDNIFVVMVILASAIMAVVAIGIVYNAKTKID